MHSNQTQSTPVKSENSEVNPSPTSNESPVEKMEEKEGGRRRKTRGAYVLKAGDRVGRLILIRPNPISGKPRWLCACDCGTEVSVNERQLIEGLELSGGTRSCGCYKRDNTSRVHKTHGLTAGPKEGRSVEYKTWCEIRKRCTDVSKKFKDYGGRGIKLCSGWSSSAEKFVADMGPRPSSDHSIDRMDVDGHYSCGGCEECLANEWPMNCRWATEKDQQRNKRNTKWISYNGETKSLAEWCETLGLNYPFMYYRIEESGMDPEEAFTKPSRRRNRPISASEPSD